MSVEKGAQVQWRNLGERLKLRRVLVLWLGCCPNLTDQSELEAWFEQPGVKTGQSWGSLGQWLPLATKQVQFQSMNEQT